MKPNELPDDFEFYSGNKHTRRIVQIASSGEFLYALTNDHKVYMLDDCLQWHKVPEIPQD